MALNLGRKDKRITRYYSKTKQNPSPKGKLFFPPLISLSKNCVHNEVWGYAEILPKRILTEEFSKADANDTDTRFDNS